MINRIVSSSLFYFSDHLIWFIKSKLYLFSVFDKILTDQNLVDDEDCEIISINISKDNLLTICCTNKFVYLVKLKDSRFIVVGKYLHQKRAVTSIRLSETNEIVLFDKFGDAYSIPITFFKVDYIYKKDKKQKIDEFCDVNLMGNDSDETIFPKMGHLSSITCSVKSCILNYLFVGNKCGKIWVSNSMNLEHTISILCGHDDAITSLYEISLFSKSNSYLISCSLDKKIKIWNYSCSEEIDSIDIEVSWFNFKS
ncbi:hypothetical protein RS030_81325 [Cryptosporidium xiaoi]|uniref:Uncharacterized protein n=1 Tax=Cryptosporidium xiaoi TaxID=659607 RepID=A0AAV9XTR5_9CRYT